MSPLPTNIKINTRVEQQTQTKEKERRQHQPKPSDTKECPNCHAQIEKINEFCPECGHKLVDYCTFCGASMSRNDTVCEECGMPAEGIKCPKCGTLNARSFCRKCNEPLTRAAIRAIEKAQQDPKVKKAAAMMDKVAELEKKITQMKTGQPLQTVKPSQPIITKADRLVMEMLGTMPKQEESAKTEVVEESESLQQLQEEYDNMVKDINDVLASFVPPNGSTPQEQFAFFSAQKVAIEKTRTIFDHHEEISAYWVCKAYGCTHTDPSQCSKPSKGGTWYYGKHFVTEIKTEHYTEYKYEN